MATIFHAHLHGDRDTKYDQLMNSTISDTEWLKILPQTPFYLLIPQDTQLLKEYNDNCRITDIFTFTGQGFTSHRDSFAIAFTKEEAKQRLAIFSDEAPDVDLSKRYELTNTSTWDLSEARKKLELDPDYEKCIQPCLYRPFDNRYCLLHGAIMDRPRFDSQRHMMRANLALSTTRSVEIGRGFEHVFCTENVLDRHGVSLKEINYLFPIYFYSEHNILERRESEEQRRTNFSKPFLSNISDRLGYTPTPEAIFYYIYAILHSPAYRSRYAEFLKIDFPRVPLTSNDKLFRKLATYGEQLVALHLMKAPQLDKPIAQFVEQGGNRIVDPAHPKYSNGKVTINKKGDGFTGVPEEVWNFYVGGYPVCAKWLKDRKGRTLSQEDITHYQRIVVALQETIKLMDAIDKAIPGFPIQ